MINKVFEKCVYYALYEHFVKKSTKYQHDFKSRRSVLTCFLKICAFLQKIFESFDKILKDEIIAFHADFSKAFDKVPHRKHLKEIAKQGVGGCLLQVLDDYLKNRKQFVRVDNVSSETPDKTTSGSGVPQGSLLDSLH